VTDRQTEDTNARARAHTHTHTHTIYIYIYIVPYLLKARTVGPEKQPLLENGSVNTSRCNG
jgi:hypothetical protein